MDGTLFDTEFIFQRIWNEIAGEMGLVLPDSFKYEICGTNGAVMNGAVMNGVIEKYYHVPDGQVIQNECRRRVDKIFAQYVPEKPGCREILHFFRKHGYKIAMGSSSRITRIEGNLHQTGLRDAFDAIAGGDEVEHGKPEPDVFLLAASRLGVDPGDCYVFEDSPNGVRAGVKAGMRTIMVPDLMPVTDDLRDIAYGIFKSLSEAQEFLEKEI